MIFKIFGNGNQKLKLIKWILWDSDLFKKARFLSAAKENLEADAVGVVEMLKFSSVIKRNLWTFSLRFCCSFYEN